MRKLPVLALSLIVCLTFNFSVDAVQLGGYYKNFFTVLNGPTPSEPVIGAVSNRLRLNLSHRSGKQLSFDASYNFSLRVQDPSLFESQLTFLPLHASEYRVADVDSQVYPGADDPVGSFGIFQNLDRAVITFSLPVADIYLGRQAIAWGSAHVINPTDIIAPFTFDELDTEDRIGVDAVRVRIPFGVLGEFDTGYVFGKDFEFENSAFFLRSRFNLMTTDISLLLLGFREHLLAGFDIARSIGGAGFWLEGAYVFVNAFDDAQNSEAKDYFRGSIGLDYSFSGKTYGFIEYHFNQAGAKHPEDYLTNLDQPAYTDGTVYLMGRHYLAPGIAYQITPLITASGQILVNVPDPSISLSTQLEYNIAQDIYVAAGAFIGIGKRPENMTEKDGTTTQRFRSEFGGYPNIYYSSFRIYF